MTPDPGIPVTLTLSTFGFIFFLFYFFSNPCSEIDCVGWGLLICFPLLRKLHPVSAAFQASSQSWSLSGSLSWLPQLLAPTDPFALDCHSSVAFPCPLVSCSFQRADVHLRFRNVLLGCLFFFFKLHGELNPRLFDLWCSTSAAAHTGCLFLFSILLTAKGRLCRGAPPIRVQTEFLDPACGLYASHGMQFLEQPCLLVHFRHLLEGMPSLRFSVHVSNPERESGQNGPVEKAPHLE